MKSERNLKQETEIAIIEHKEKAKLTKWFSSAHRKLKMSVTFAIILEFVSGGGIFATDFVAIFLFAYFSLYFLLKNLFCLNLFSFPIFCYSSINLCFFTGTFFKLPNDLFLYFMSFAWRLSNP